MRLKQIKIINFGQFSNKTFDLPSDQLDVFFGANEAGKSTTVAFIKQILFGFHLRSNSSPFFEDYTPLAHVSPMGGSLVFTAADGEYEYELERLYAKGDKTKRGILTVKKDGQVVPESVFFDQIQNIDGSFYADSFIFNQEMLGQVTSLSQADLLERIYYLGAANSSQLLQLRDDFAKDAGKLFKKTGKKPEVNRLLKQMTDDREHLTATQAEFSDYEQLDQKFSAQKEILQEKQSILAKLQKQEQSLRDLQKELGNYQNLLDLQKQVKDVAFDGENYQRAQDIMAQGRNLQKTIESLKEQLTELTDSSEDFTAAKELIQQNPQLLQWQAEYKACLQKGKQLKQEKEQLLTLTPDIEPLLGYDQAQIKQLQNDYLALPKQVDSAPQVNNTNNKFWYAAGAVFAVIGLIIIITMGMVGVAALSAGFIFLIIGYSKANQQKASNASILQKQQLAQSKREDFKQKYGLNSDTLDLNNVLTNLGQYHLKESAEADNNEQINEINQEVAQLSTAVQNTLKQPVENDFTAVLTALDEVANHVDSIQASQQKKASLTASLKQDEQDLKELGLKLKTIFAQANVENMAGYDELYQESLRQAKIKTQVNTLKESLGQDLAQLKELNASELLQKLHKLDQQMEAATSEISTAQQELAQLQVKLNNLADSTAVFQAKQDLANTETNFINSSKEYLADLLASTWISRSLDIASNERFPKMIAAAQEYFALLTGGRYTGIDLAKKLTVIRHDGKKREVKYLSRGTAEQLYFALKLAFIEQIKDKINLPILIDDSFVNFDDRRVSYIEKLLKRISENNQVLIFTAQEKLVDQLQIEPLTFTKGTQNA